MTRSITNLAAIDIGTNSIHLIVAKADRTLGRFRILSREKEVVRLGAGPTDMKYLTEGAMARAIQVLQRFRVAADSLRAPIRAVATSAVREALNQDEFLRRVRSETGIKVEIASGFEEARLIHLGVLQALPVFKKQHLMIDIGGGSTEFLVGYQRRILYDNSLKIGAVRLTQRFFEKHRTSLKVITQCGDFVRGMLSPIRRSVRKAGFELAIGTSGTVSNIANIIRASRDEDEDGTLNGFTFTKEELLDAADLILRTETSEERAKIDGLDPARVDIIVAGSIILKEIFRELGIKRMTVSEYALREGILLDTLESLNRRRHTHSFHNLRYANVLHLAKNLHYEESHAKQVESLSMRIFDQTKSIHGLGAQDREYLEAAALLHEVGLFVSHAQHHRHSYYLIRNSEILGFTENEKEIIANVARYHRKSHPKIKHEGYNKLSSEDQGVVRKLSAILRIADGLDRTHGTVVKDIRCTIRKGSVTFKLHHAKNARVELELWGANRKKQLFEDVFHSAARFVG